MSEMKALTLLALLTSVACAKRTVKTGLDVLIENNYTQLAGRKVIVLTNPTGVTPDLDLGVDVMFNSGAVDLVGVMGPEHGFRGTAQAGGSEGTFVDPGTGLTVYVRFPQHVCPNQKISSNEILTAPFVPGRVQCQHEHTCQLYQGIWSRHRAI